MNNFELFTELHYQNEPLLIGNVWDVESAKIFEQNNYKAIGTSSAALANTQGYKDGENIPFQLLLSIAERIAGSTSIPLTVDMEAGYATSSSMIIENIEKLHQAGVVGINYEDSIIGANPQLIPLEASERAIFDIANYLNRNNIGIFLNARIDTYLLTVTARLEETLIRSKAYENAGANGIFVPCMVEKSDIARVVSNTKLPVNVMCMPDLPSFMALKDLGIRRISMASFVYKTMIKYLEASIQRIEKEGTFSGLFADSIAEGLKVTDIISQ